MKRRMFGPALWYASDKNIFDALVQKHKVDASTLATLFRNRNTIVSKKTDRDLLAEHFSRLSHDYYDHKLISEKIGVAPRRERATSMELVGELSSEAIQTALEELRRSVTSSGDIAHVSRNGENFSITIQYSRYDYKKSEFSQLVVKDAVIEVIKTATGYNLISPQNEFINNIRDELVSVIEDKSDEPFEKFNISLFGFPDPKQRTKFFIETMTAMKGFTRRDVTDVFVYKPKPDKENEGDLASDEDETHIERVLLRGNGVTQSSILLDLVESDEYYIAKICWLARRTLGNGDIYKIEASFADPKNCEGFSVLVKSVYPNVDGRFSKYRTPLKPEIDELSRAVEVAAKEVVQTYLATK